MTPEERLVELKAKCKPEESAKQHQSHRFALERAYAQFQNYSDPEKLLGKMQLRRGWLLWKIEVCISDGWHPRKGHFYVWLRQGEWFRRKSALASAQANGWDLVDVA